MFKIVGIECGWFDFILSNQTSEYYISSSKVGGYDSAKALLNAVSDIFYRKIISAKISFYAENEIHIIQLISEQSSLKIEIIKSDDSSFKYIGKEFLSLNIDMNNPPILTINCDVSEFALEICKEFGDFIKMNKESEYETNWFEFPYAEYDNLYRYFKYRL